MLRYKTETRPDLVALYDIRPGNGADQFLQPRSPHGAPDNETTSFTHLNLTSTEASSGPNVYRHINPRLTETFCRIVLQCSCLRSLGPGQCLPPSSTVM